ncbi:hypothetical protein LCGC14_2784900 [marine sediment metagenome]|uniref:Uncharacterized protein n=1 Tax=marine sediment metagenome TaxID=412755 RepID=A0A0F9BIP1_9ZZZZ
MIKVETLVYEYEECLGCRHCGFNQWKSTEYVWGCDLADRRLLPNLHLRMENAKIPEWCPLPTKGANLLLANK